MVVDEADGERDVLDAGGEDVLLVEEQDRRRRREAWRHVVTDSRQDAGPTRAGT